MDISIVISWTMSTLFVIGMVAYSWSVITGRSIFYTSTRLIILGTSSINTMTYFIMTNYDFPKSSLVIVGAATHVILCGLVISRGKFTKLHKLDWAVIAIALIACIVWLGLGQTSWGNVILQGGILIAFVPTLRGVYIGNPENPWPFGIWIVAQALNLLVIWLRWEGPSDAFALVSPTMFMLVSVAIVIMTCRKTKSCEA